MIEITEKNFEEEVIKSNIPVLVDFWATWCAPCVKIVPVLEELSSEYEGKMNFAKVNIENDGSIAQQFGIMSIPTLLIFKGGKVMQQIVGVQPKNNIVAKIKEIL